MALKTNTYYPILKKEDVPVGSTWYSADGSSHKVVVTAVDLESQAGWTTYEWEDPASPSGKRTHEKSSFAFQCRYKLPSAGITETHESR